MANATNCVTSKVLAGNTVVLNFQFRDWHDNNIPVENIFLTTFDQQGNIITKETDITYDVSNIDVGRYFYLYTMPTGHDSIIVELKTIFDNQYPILIKRAVRLINSRN